MMKAAVFYGTKDIRVQNFESGEIKDNQVRIQVHAAGVCGTDIHIYQGDEGSATVFPPVILGHEFAGQVVETGKKVKNLSIGDRVSIDPNIYCGECKYCRNGKVHLCDDLSAIGVTVHGGFAEYCIVPASQAFKLPDEVSYEQGAMGEPIACCLHGIDLIGITPGDQVLIIGGGTIGLIMLLLARIAGAAKLIISEPVAEKRDLSLKLGADLTIDPGKERFYDRLQSLTGDGADVVIECVGTKTSMEQAINATRKGGRVMMFGLTPPDCEIPLKPFDVFRKELTIKSSFINPFTQARAIELLGSGRIAVNELIADVVPLDAIVDIFENEDRRKKGKVIITP